MDIKNIKELSSALNGSGCFLTAGKKPNVMTISWGAFGALYNKEILIVPVRNTRYTKEFIDSEKCFCVSIPDNSLKQALTFCGTKSGRDYDKFKECNLKIQKCKSIDTFTIGECNAYFECKVLFSIPLKKDMLPKEVYEKFYKLDDIHELYFGEVIEKY